MRVNLRYAGLFATTLLLASCRDAEPDQHAIPPNQDKSGEAFLSRFKLEATEFYTPVKPSTDAGGFHVAGSNSTESIRALREINGLATEELERRMRPGSTDERGSTAGFIGIDESLLKVLADDNDFVISRTLTHRHLAIPLLQLSHRAAALHSQTFDKVVEFEHAGVPWKVEIEASKGYQLSPFDDGDKTDMIFTISNLVNGKQLKFSGLVPLMIERYGFYEGHGTPYRVDPAEILTLFGP